LLFILLLTYWAHQQHDGRDDEGWRAALLEFLDSLEFLGSPFGNGLRCGVRLREYLPL